MSDLPTEDEFKTMYGQWQEACRNKNRDFIRPMLPDDMPNPFFAELMGQFNMMERNLSASGVTPVLKQEGVSYQMLYEGDLGDGMSMMTEDFFYIDGKWLKYDPAEE